MPRVAQTVADFCERPIAKALGIGVSITQTRGLGRFACTQRRSMMPCSSGSCSGVTCLTPSVAIAILSEVKSCNSRKTSAIGRIAAVAVPAAIKAPMNTT